MRTFEDFKELKAAIGTEVGISDWLELTQQRIDRFAEVTGDQQWIHVDVERATRELPGQTTIAHGLLTLALARSFGIKRKRYKEHFELRSEPDPLFDPGASRFKAARSRSYSRTAQRSASYLRNYI